MDAYRVDELKARRKASAADYLELFSKPAMSAGAYFLPKGALDPQQPHTEDEMYYIISGKGKFTCAGETVDADAGKVLFVEKKVGHRFHDITEDMTILVVFAPAEGANKK